MKKIAVLLSFILLIFSLCGCGMTKAIRVAVENKDLRVYGINNDAIHFDAMPGDKVYIHIIDRTSFGILNDLAVKLTEEIKKMELQLVTNPDEADYIVYLDLTDEATKKTAREMMGGSHDGGAVVGGTAGFMAGVANGRLDHAIVGLVVGTVVGAATDLTSSAIKVSDIHFYEDIKAKKKSEESFRRGEIQVEAMKFMFDWKDEKNKIVAAIAKQTVDNLF